jgi:hypothetical protein
MRRLLAGCAVLLALAGCGETGETADDQAAREYNICLKQADRITETHGARAGAEKAAQCVETRDAAR